jgi:hypothetical protein
MIIEDEFRGNGSRPASGRDGEADDDAPYLEAAPLLAAVEVPDINGSGTSASFLRRTMAHALAAVLDVEAPCSRRHSAAGFLLPASLLAYTIWDVLHAFLQRKASCLSLPGEQTHE